MTALNDTCKDCHSFDRCRAVYGRLGCDDIPPLTGQVVAAFLVPQLAFLVGWVCVDRLGPSKVIGPLVGLLLAGLAVLWARTWISRSCRPGRQG